MLDKLKELYSYDKDTGVFTRRIDVTYNAKAGDVAGSKLTNGYLALSVNGKQYLAHRMAWLYTYGELPDDSIDHINHDKTDNRIENLREVTQQGNARNALMQSNNTSGCRGVTWCKTKHRWKARIKIDGKDKALGSYVDFSDAVDARKNAEVLYGFHENHGKTLEEINNG